MSNSMFNLWSNVGSLNVASSKGASTTTWIWNIHSIAHDIETQHDCDSLKQRKVFVSNLAHISVVLIWLGGMYFHMAYYSNVSAWNMYPKHCSSCAHSVYALVGQDIINSDVGGYFQGVASTAGLFHLCRSHGVLCHTYLCWNLTLILSFSVLLVGASYFHMHLAWFSGTLTSRYTAIHLHHSILVLGLGSISWSGHLIHLSVPTNLLLDIGVVPEAIPAPHDLLLCSCCYNFLLASEPSESDPSGLLMAACTHHLFIGVFFVVVCSFCLHQRILNVYFHMLNYANHAQLSVNLIIVASSSLLYAHIAYSTPVYPFMAADYPTCSCLFFHHMWVGCILTVGAAAHCSISIIRDVHYDNSIWQVILHHRCMIQGHIIYISVFLGLHSFGLLIHNDTMQALGRPDDMFGDCCIQLRPVFAIYVQSMGAVCWYLELLDQRIVRMSQELGTSDFIIHHIHSFTIHVCVLILLKGVLFARNSRLVSDKLELGWRYPCDGPGRGGTCQISPYDHLYLAVFWMYNSASVVVFHFYWKLQSDLFGYMSATNDIQHLCGSDFCLNATSINGWLRSFLWTQASQVIQSYGSSLCGYGLIFLGAHFIWAFSLMFLFSGRGYWQELIESILWAHQKLMVVNQLQPRALSIIHGRAAGVTHFIVGGIGCTWSFVIARILQITG